MCNRSSYPYWMRRIQRLCGLQLVWLLFLDSKWQTGRQITLFCGVSRNDEAIRRVVLYAVYRNSAIALRSFEINKITSSVLVLRNILHSFPTTSVYALLQYLWEIGVQLASPAFLHHKSQTTSPVSVLWIFRLCVGEPQLVSVQKLYKCANDQELPRQVA